MLINYGQVVNICYNKVVQYVGFIFFEKNIKNIKPKQISVPLIK